MTWYIIILVTMLIPMAFAYLGHIRNIDTSKLVILFSASVLLLFMSCRSTNVGADTAQYTYGFKQISNTSLKELFDIRVIGLGGGYELNFEYGYRLFNKLVSFFSTSGQTITIANSILILSLLFSLIKNESDDVFLSVWLYITLGIFQTQMNMARNAIAILFCYHGLKYIEEKKLSKYLFFVVLGTLFHTSSILFIPFYWIVPKVELTKKNLWTIIASSIVLGLGFSIVRPYFVRYLPLGLGEYFVKNTAKFESLVVGALHILLMLYVWVLISKTKRDDAVKEEKVGIWMFIANVIFFSIGFDVAAAARMAALFGPYLIILIPNMIKRGTKSENKRMLIVAVLIILTGIQYILRLNINNIGSTMPYEFFWN